MTQQFQVGATYTTRSIANADCIISTKIIKRTTKTVTVESNDLMGEKVKTFRISKFQEIEFFKPWGNYSMSPIIKAN